MPKLFPRRRPALFAFCAWAVALPASAAFAQQSTPKVDFGIGASMLDINKVEFGAVTDFLVTQTLSQQDNQDGQLSGYKLTGGVSGLLPHQRGDWLSSMAVKGFYASYKDDQQSRCTFTASTDCVFFPLVDPDPNGTIGLPGGADASGGFFSDWLTDVHREVTHWGGAIEIDLNRNSAPAVSLKDKPAPAEPAPFQWRAGLAVRRLDQKTSLISEDFGFATDPVRLNDSLDTSYYGGYVGFESWRPVGEAFRVKLSGETGLYYAKADYNGAYSATTNLGDNTPLSQSLSLSDSAPAFIGSVNLTFERDFGRATLALFSEAEWISYVPKVLYSDTDLNGGVPFDITGNQNGTALGDGSALTYTIGARLSLNLQ